jgi:hypothetical protein
MAPVRRLQEKDVEVIKPTATPKLQREPLQLKDVLNEYEYFDVTPVIGREFPTVNLKEWLRAPNSDELLRDLAITGKRINRRFLFTVCIGRKRRLTQLPKTGGGITP